MDSPHVSLGDGDEESGVGPRLLPAEPGSCRDRWCHKYSLVAFGLFCLTLTVAGLASLSIDNQSGASPPPPAQSSHAVLLVSFDGFRYDYAGRGLSPTLTKFRNRGIAAEAMKPVFPSKTFPNHYSLVTGLLPVHHGIVGNTFVDPVYGTFTISTGSDQGMWWGGEPIWATAQRQGLKSGCMFWPGCDAPIGPDGVRPTYHRPYNYNYPYTERVDTILEWLALPESERPSMLTLYFEAADSAGHAHGPDSPEVDDAIELLDATMKRLFDGMDRMGVTNTTDVIIVADHGMTSLDSNHVVFLDDVLDMSTVTVVTWSPVLQLAPVAPTRAAEVVATLNNANVSLTAYEKADVLPRLKYGSPGFESDRLQPVIAVADEHYTLTTRSHFTPYTGTKGTHGFDNDLQSMWATFMAAGPSFVPTPDAIPLFDNLEVYPLLARLLGIDAAPNDGTLDALSPYLR